MMKKHYLTLAVFSILIFQVLSFPTFQNADATGCTATGGNITTSGGRTIHTFQINGTYTVTSGTCNVQVLVVGGGGGGAVGTTSDGATGGGGAGGFISNSSYAVSPQSYTVTVGKGATAVTAGAGGFNGNNGTNSVFGQLTAKGGGGGSYTGGGRLGGSGGGGGGAAGITGGSGTSGQGHAGGAGKGSSVYPSGGGGGANAVGGSFSGSVSGAGGNGNSSSISGSSVTYAGGGGGSADSQGATAGVGGSGGGGAGASSGSGTSGTPHTGGGGGAGYPGNGNSGGAGGSGIVIISEVTPSGTPPAAPTLQKSNRVNSTAITSSWTSSPGATYYLLFRASPVGGSFTQIVNQSGTTYTDNSLSGGIQYQYKVEAGNATGGAGTASNTKSNYTTNIAPTGLTLNSLGPTSARIAVTNPSGNFSGYKIEKESPDGGGFSTVTSNTGNTTARYDFTGLSPSTQYNVRFSTNYAFGTNASGTSSPSANFSFYTTAPAVGGKTQGFYVTRNGTSEPLYSSNLIGYWKMDGLTTSNKMEDYSSTKANGTVTGSFVNATGLIGNAVSFLGSNYITTSNSPYAFERTSPFSISIWLNYYEASTKPLYAKLSTAANGGYYLSELASGHVQFVFQDTSKNNYTTDCATVVNNLSWHNVIVTYAGGSNTNNLKCYVDGSLTATGSNTSIGASIVSTATFTMGDWSNGGTGATATEDDVRIYNKVLSSAEVTKIYSYRLNSALSKLDTYLVHDGKTYNYCIYPVNEYGQNDTGTCITAIGKTYAAPPNQLNGKFYKDGSNLYHVQINWSKPSQFLSDNFLATGYKLQKLIGSTWTDIFTNTTATSYTDSSLQSITTQKYRLFSYSHFGLSPGYIFENTNGTGLVSLYQFENNTLDSKGSNTVSFNGLENYTNGIIGYGLALNGTSYAISTNTGIPSGTNDRTFSLWIKPSSFSTSSNGYMTTGTSSANSAFGIIDANGKIDCGGSGNNVNSTTTLTANHWALVTCVLSNSGQTRSIYINGTLDKSSTTTAINSASTSLYIGTRSDDTTKDTTGLFDNVRVYNTALNATYVSELYNQAITTKDNSAIAGTHTVVFTTVGDVTRATSRLLITTGFPPPTIVNWHLYNYSTVYNNTNVNTSPVPNVASTFLYGNWFNIDVLHNFKAVAVVSNGTTNTLINSSTYPIQYIYLPNYKTTNGVMWNYTLSRPAPSTNLTLLANENPILFSMNCKIQTASDAAAGKGNGWYNNSNVGYFLQSLSIHSYDNIYGTCYTNSSQKLFTFVSYGNSSLFPAINFMNQSYGAYIGVPVGVVFIVMAAALGNRRTAPMWVVIILAMAGIMSTLAFFTLNSGVWALALIAGLLALFVGRKIG